jgi:hypothetical protein
MGAQGSCSHYKERNERERVSAMVLAIYVGLAVVGGGSVVYSLVTAKDRAEAAAQESKKSRVA